jgi:hypothetical protein
MINVIFNVLGVTDKLKEKYQRIHKTIYNKKLNVNIK